MAPISARSRTPIKVLLSIESSSLRASSADSTGVLPRLTTYFGPVAIAEADQRTVSFGRPHADALSVRLRPRHPRRRWRRRGLFVFRNHSDGNSKLSPLR